MISDEIKNKLIAQPRGIGDLGEIGTFDSVNSICNWAPLPTDTASYGVSTVIDCKHISTSIVDPSIIISTSSTAVSLTGEYGISLFDLLSYKFKDTETNEIFHVKGWPPTDPRAKFMFELSQDPRETRDVEYVVEFIAEFDFSGLLVSPPSDDVPPPPPPTATELNIITDSVGSNYNFYVDESTEKAYRKDSITFNQTVRNYSFKNLGPQLAAALKSI
jgi:hypothetical protein